MNAIAQSLKELTIGKPTQFRGLTVFPLFGPGTPEPGYITLDEALKDRSLEVAEVSAAGSVPELRVVNSGTQRVLLMDGEELVGAKQNRTINLSILVPPGKTLIIPVSCVERGRWRHSSPRFTTSASTYYSRGRAMRTSQVSESMRSTGARSSDQGAVWDDIEMKSIRLNTVSSTSAMAAMFETKRTQIEEFVRAFQPGDEEIGLLFAIEGRVSGMEIFDSHATLRKLMPKILRGYALDAVDSTSGSPSGTPDRAECNETEAREFLDNVAAAEIRDYPAVGDGEEVRMTGRAVTGAALLDHRRIIHLCAFRKS